MIHLEALLPSLRLLGIDLLPRAMSPPEIFDFWCVNETEGLVNAGIHHGISGIYGGPEPRF